MFKHAYLIIAHNEFELLAKLVNELDDYRNDIYIHYDKKVKKIPHITSQKAGLKILQNRINVCWGDVSQIESELILFKEAFSNGVYSYYHLLSGVDFPIKSQDIIHDFFKKNEGKEFIGFLHKNVNKEIDFRVKRYHLITKFYRKNIIILTTFVRVINFLVLRGQFILGIKRFKNINFKKGASWVSVTHDFVEFLLSHYENILSTYKYSYCADEIFIQTLCWNSEFRKNIFDVINESNGCQRLIGWNSGNLIDWNIDDYDFLTSSNLLFARKFNSKSINLIKRIQLQFSSNEI